MSERVFHFCYNFRNNRIFHVNDSYHHNVFALVKSAHTFVLVKRAENNANKDTEHTAVQQGRKMEKNKDATMSEFSTLFRN